MKENHRKMMIDTHHRVAAVQVERCLSLIITPIGVKGMPTGETREKGRRIGHPIRTRTMNP